MNKKAGMTITSFNITDANKTRLRHHKKYDGVGYSWFVNQAIEWYSDCYYKQNKE